MRSIQFHDDVTARALEATWRFADTTPRVDAARMRLTPTPQHDKQPAFVSYSKQRRLARKTKLQAQAS